MIVIVSGDRAWADGGFIAAVLDGLDITTIYEGCAPGADRWAGDHEWIDQVGEEHVGWAKTHDIETRHFPAGWGRYRRLAGRNPAGAIRNRVMFEAAQAVGLSRVLAFHDDYAHSRGTRDMVILARNGMVPVTLYSHTKTVQFDPALRLPLDT